MIARAPALVLALALAPGSAAPAEAAPSAATSSAIASSVAAKWPAWKTVAPVVLADAAQPHLVRLRLPAALDPGPDATYPDLRLVDDGGTETAYAFAAADDEGAAAGAARTGRPQPVLEPLPVAGTPQTDPASHRQSWTFTGRVALRPTAVAFAGGGGTYVRRVTVESSDDGTTWTETGAGTIARYARGGAQSSFAFAQATARRWRVTVENGSDPPVPGLRPALLARPRELLFRAAPHRRYALLSGNPHAVEPRYDLAAQLAHEHARAGASATAGALTDNPAYADTRPLPERFPWLLTAVLLAVAALMALLAVRTLRASNARDTTDHEIRPYDATDHAIRP